MLCSMGILLSRKWVHCLPANEKGAFIKEPQHQDPPFILVPLYPHASFFEICTPGAMHLYLSSPSALNSFYSTETGRPLYKVETPLISVGETRRTIIRRAVDTVDGVWLGEKEKKSDSEDLNNALISYVQTRCVSPTSTTTRSSSDSRNDGTFEGHFAHLAHIEYALLKSSRILYAGHELRTDKLFQPKGWTWYGMSRYIRTRKVLPFSNTL
ncbi:hypothetical protein AN958_00257 [Leucoagaricus sp. SymC.cos]|nr:hypothetical protein AN958_00257 [Leucoagaricus sp. SymC.cos]